jgi:hypothetical protein
MEEDCFLDDEFDDFEETPLRETSTTFFEECKILGEPAVTE